MQRTGLPPHCTNAYGFYGSSLICSWLPNTVQTGSMSGDEGYKTIKYSGRKTLQPPHTYSKHQTNIYGPFNNVSPLAPSTHYFISILNPTENKLAKKRDLDHSKSPTSRSLLSWNYITRIWHRFEITLSVVVPFQNKVSWLKFTIVRKLVGSLLESLSVEPVYYNPTINRIRWTCVSFSSLVRKKIESRIR